MKNINFNIKIKNNLYIISFLLLNLTLVFSQNLNSTQKLTNQNLEFIICDNDGYTTLNIEDIENFVIQNIGIENNYFLEQVLISTSKGNIHSINTPSNNPNISTLCELSDSFNYTLTDIAVNSNQQIFLGGSPIFRIDDNCNVFSPYNYDFWPNNALSFDDLDKLYIGKSTNSNVYRLNINDITMSDIEVWHDFIHGTSGGDFVLLNDKMYISWKLGNENYRLYEVTINQNRDYISHIDLGQLPNKTYGLASELGKLYGVTPSKLFEINLTDFSFTNVIQNPNPEDEWYGAAGMHEAIIFNISTHQTLYDAENNENEINGYWENTIYGGETLYIRIENSLTGEFSIVLLDVIISSYPNVNQPLNLIKCFNNDLNIFDLNEVSSQMKVNTNDNLTFSFYNTNPENNSSFAIPTQYQSTTKIETLFVKVTNDYCEEIFNFQIINKDNPNLLPLSNFDSSIILNSCFFDDNNNIYFNLKDVEDDIILSDDNLEITYFLSYLDAENNINEISNIFYIENDIEEIFLKATDNQGCFSISNFFLNKSCFINNETLTNFKFPKFITPNGDGINDFWNIIVLSPNTKRKSSVTIFNRFGKILFQFDPDSIIGWDGTYNGHILPSSDYWYIFKTENGLQKVGHFTLKK